MADRVTQVVAEVLRSSAVATPASASTTITFSFTAAKNAALEAAGATTVTFTGTGSGAKTTSSSAATTITFSYTASQNSARLVGASTLLLFSYVATENSAVNVSGSTTITFFANCSGDKAASASASTTITFSGSGSEVSAFAKSGATTVTFSDRAYHDLDILVNATTTITFSSVISNTRDIVTSASTRVTLSSFGFGDGNHGQGISVVSLSGQADCVKLVAGHGSTNVTLSGAGGGVRNLPRSAQTTITATGTAGDVRVVEADATTQIRFRSSAVPLNKAQGGNAMAANRVGYLGRFQQGQVLTLVLRTLGYQGRIILPDAYPVAAIWDDGSNLVATVNLPAKDRANSIFALPIFVDRGFSLGRYRVVYRYVFGAYVGTAVDYFEVIDGGDPGGTLISLCSYDRPEASYVLAQLSAGKLVQGRNPKI